MTKIKDLRPNLKNPRKMDIADKRALKKSLLKFGDLSAIVYNRRTKRLVGGHQRTGELPPDAIIHIDKKFETPTKAYTVTEGFIEIEGERFRYREVDAPEKWETEALLAANKHSGSWDEEILRVNFADFPHMDLEAIGFDETELDDLGISWEDITPDDILNDSDSILNTNETDGQYMKKNSGSQEYEGGQNLPDMVKRTYTNDDTTPKDITDIDPDAENPFDSAGQKTEMNTKKRFVLIIDVDNDEIKKKLKDQIRPLVEEVGGRFF